MAIFFVLMPIRLVNDVNIAKVPFECNLGPKYVSVFKDANRGNSSYNLDNVRFEEWTSV